ncbi:MAG: penicillin-binding protein 1A [Rickettsiales bacterium]|jgi:penicillin-binding protein 1A
MLKFSKFFFKWLIVSSIWAGFIFAGILFYYLHDLPTLEEIQAANDKQVVEILYSGGNKITTLGDLYANQITFNQIPAHLIDAVVATEDRKFFNHSGYDLGGIARAFLVNFKAGRIVQGGSTITQQLAKRMFLKSEKTIKRKIQEFVLALRLEGTFSKEQILALYLNRAYFGSGNYGIANASRYYFGKKVENLNLNESAMLAGILKAPSKLSPKNNYKLAQKRTNQVIENMANAGFLGGEAGKFKSAISYQSDKLQRFYFTDYVAERFSDYLSIEDQLNNGRFSIISTLDENLQEIVEKETDRLARKYPTRLGKSQIALILMDKKGAIRAMIGGRDYQKSQFNRAIYSKRQAGSAFKIFVYLTALQNGFEPDDLVDDKEFSLGEWSPKNYNEKYYGEVTLKDSFAKSLNSVSVQLTGVLNRDDILNNALKMGITSKIDNHDATFALGTAQVSLFELVNSYASIASGGEAVLPYFVEKIYGGDELLYEKNFSEPFEIIDEENVIKMKELLREVVESGTGRAANVSRNIHGKTGTSQNYRDAWFIGFSDQYVLGVWVGNDDNSATNRVVGGSLPAILFGDVMKKID